jgi:hypothetical protein
MTERARKILSIPPVRFLILTLLFLAPISRAGQFLTPSNPPPVVSLEWDLAPAVTYRIYYGIGSGQYTNVATVGPTNFCTLTLTRGATYYFAATAVDSTGLESNFGSEVSFTPKIPPGAPANMRQPLVLTVQVAPTPAGQWADAGMNWAFQPDATNQFLRVQIAQANPAAPLIK